MTNVVWLHSNVQLNISVALPNRISNHSTTNVTFHTNAKTLSWYVWYKWYDQKSNVLPYATIFPVQNLDEEIQFKNALLRSEPIRAGLTIDSVSFESNRIKYFSEQSQVRLKGCILQFIQLFIFHDNFSSSTFLIEIYWKWAKSQKDDEQMLCFKCRTDLNRVSYSSRAEWNRLDNGLTLCKRSNINILMLICQ